MTRFARAKGSKASNERRPEESTSWKDMRKQLEINQNEAQKVEESEVKPSWKHKILNDTVHEQNENSCWTSFNDDSSKRTSKKKKYNYKNTDNSLISQNDVTLTTENEIVQKDTTNVKNKKRKNITSITAKNQHNDSTITDKNKADSNSVTEKEKINKKNVGIKRKKNKSNKKQVNIEGDNEISIKNKQMFQSKKGKPNSVNENDNQLQPNDKVSTSEATSKNKKHKLIDNNNYKRRKPNPGNYTAFINGKTVEIVSYEGFYIKSEDAENLRKLRKQFIKKGVPRTELQALMKLERRKAEKALTREKKKVCFQCRKSGHNLSDCPELENNGTTVSGICFKCGSTEHTYYDCKVSRGEDFRFAQCFICKEEGHIAKQCPDNPRGLYPRGGACRMCGDVTHMKKDCPDLKQKSEETGVTVQKFNDRSLDVLDEELHQFVKPTKQQPNKKIKFF